MQAEQTKLKAFRPYLASSQDIAESVNRQNALEVKACRSSIALLKQLAELVELAAAVFERNHLEVILVADFACSCHVLDPMPKVAAAEGAVQQSQ